MRIATVRAAGAEHVAAADADAYRRLDTSEGLADLLRGGIDPRQLQLGEPVDGRPAAPLRPGKIVAIGLNYLDHIRESSLERPTRPLVFAKFPSSVIGPNDAIELDETLTTRGDWELAVADVVGWRTGGVPGGDARGQIFGGRAANHGSAG